MQNPNSLNWEIKQLTHVCSVCGSKEQYDLTCNHNNNGLCLTVVDNATENTFSFTTQCQWCHTTEEGPQLSAPCRQRMNETQLITCLLMQVMCEKNKNQFHFVMTRNTNSHTLIFFPKAELSVCGIYLSHRNLEHYKYCSKPF